MSPEGEILSKTTDSARKIQQAQMSGNAADWKAAEAAYDDLMQAAKDAGLLDDTL